MEEVIDGVKVFFIARNSKITEYIKDYFREKFSKVILKIPEGIRESTNIYLISKKEGDSKSIEVILTVKKSNLPPIYSEDEGEDVRAVIDKLAYEIERQIEKLKTDFEKIIREAMKSKREISITEEIHDQPEEESQEIQIDRARVKIEKPISIDDAIIILEETEKKKSGKKLPIYIFNDFDGKVKVLYKQGEKKYIVFEIT